MKLNLKSAKIKPLEERGVRGASGTPWNVHYALIRPENNSAVPVAVKKMGPVYNPFGSVENTLMEALVQVYASLSPENLSCDGEASMQYVRTRRAELERQRRGLFAALGQEIDESAAYEWENSKRAFAAKVKQ